MDIDDVADLPDSCYLATAWGCQDGTLDAATCSYCDFSSKENISEECFMYVGQALETACDPQSVTSFMLSGLGLTTETFTDAVKAALESETCQQISDDLGDEDCEAT